MNLMTPAAAVTAAASTRAPEEEAACILKAAERILTGLERGLSGSSGCVVRVQDHWAI